MWPGGVQPKTKQGNITFKNDSIVLECKTEGATIAYRTNGTERWLIYDEPLSKDDVNKIEIKTVRYGYKKSETISHEVPSN